MNMDQYLKDLFMKMKSRWIAFLRMAATAAFSVPGA